MNEWYEQAVKKLEAEKKAGSYDRYANAMKDAVCETLDLFCRQDEEFAQAGQTAIHIDTAAIPAFRREELARGAIALAEQVFSMPGAEERYQAWLKERKAKKRKELKQNERNQSQDHLYRGPAGDNPGE